MLTHHHPLRSFRVCALTAPDKLASDDSDTEDEREVNLLLTTGEFPRERTPSSTIAEDDTNPINQIESYDTETDVDRTQVAAGEADITAQVSIIAPHLAPSEVSALGTPLSPEEAAPAPTPCAAPAPPVPQPVGPSAVWDGPVPWVYLPPQWDPFNEVSDRLPLSCCCITHGRLAAYIRSLCTGA